MTCPKESYPWWTPDAPSSVWWEMTQNHQKLAIRNVLSIWLSSWCSLINLRIVQCKPPWAWPQVPTCQSNSSKSCSWCAISSNYQDSVNIFYILHKLYPQQTTLYMLTIIFEIEDMYILHNRPTESIRTWKNIPNMM